MELRALRRDGDSPVAREDLAGTRRVARTAVPTALSQKLQTEFGVGQGVENKRLAKVSKTLVQASRSVFDTP